jgi:hypothetical protein
LVARPAGLGAVSLRIGSVLAVLLLAAAIGGCSSTGPLGEYKAARTLHLAPGGTTNASPSGAPDLAGCCRDFHHAPRLVAVFVDPEVGHYVAGAGWIGHAAWDVAHHRDLSHHHAVGVVPRGYAEFCIVLDFLMGASLIAAPAT